MLRFVVVQHTTLSPQILLGERAYGFANVSQSVCRYIYQSVGWSIRLSVDHICLINNWRAHRPPVISVDGYVASNLKSEILWIYRQ